MRTSMRRTSAVASTAITCALGMATLGAQGAQGTGSPWEPGRTATAASVAPWATVSAPVPVITQPDALRVGNTLQVIWSQTDGTTHSVRVRARGRPLNRPRAHPPRT